MGSCWGAPVASPTPPLATTAPAGRPPAAAAAAAAVNPPPPADAVGRAVAAAASTGTVTLVRAGLTAPPRALLAPPPHPHVTAVGLSRNALASLAGLPAGTPSLTRLDVSHNALAGLPDLRLWRRLARLDLSHNRLTDLAPLAALPRLVHLVVTHNALRSLRLVGCAALETVDVSHNAIERVRGDTFTLPRLRALRLGANALVDLPPAAADAPALALLDVSANRLTALPPRLLVGCPSLVDLRVGGNPLTAAALRVYDGYDAYERRSRGRAGAGRAGGGHP